MKTLTLKETQAPCTLTIDRDALAQHLMLVQQDGQPVGVLVPFYEYQAFRAWQQKQTYQYGERKVPTADDTLHALIASGEIQPSDLGERLRANLIPGTTLERVHEALAGVSVPIEEMIREEREKYDV